MVSVVIMISELLAKERKANKKEFKCLAETSFNRKSNFCFNMVLLWSQNHRITEW